MRISKITMKGVTCFWPYFLCFGIIFSQLEQANAGDNQEDDDDCVFNVNDLRMKQPLIMTAKSPPNFVYPNITAPTTITVEDDNPIRIVCDTTSVVVTCYDKKFWMDGTDKRFDMKQLECREENLNHIMKPVKDAPCPSKVACMYIGFQINVLDFIPTIDMIHIDPSRKRPLWAHTKLLSITKYRQLRGEAMNYKEGTIFTGMIVNMSRLFDMDYQKGRFSRILNSNKLADKYINEFAYLVKGQLIDNDDFFYKPQQNTVHYYANVVPIWTTIASGNWNLAGFAARTIAVDIRANLDLWSGTIDTLELQDSRGVKKDIYLTTDYKGHEVVPVPKIIFKYIYDPKSNRGLVILTVNNPFLTRLTSEYKLCEEKQVCSYLYPQFKDFELGYTYCCSITDFAPIAKKNGLPTFPKANHLL